MPRARWIPAAAAILAALALQPALSAPAVQDGIEATGTARTFLIYGGGFALEGGTHDWSVVCGGCLIRVTFADTQSSVIVASGSVVAVTPGLYEIREFRGLLQFTEEAPGVTFFQIHGTGGVARP